MLARQWMVFGLVLFVGFALMAVILLYVLEDRFINRRLRDAAQNIELLTQPVSLPPHFELISVDVAPSALLNRMQGVRNDGIREFRLPDGRYVHVLTDADSRGKQYLLMYDVSDQLNVNTALSYSWPWLLLAALALAMIAYALARRFVGQVSRQASSLVQRVVEADGSQFLHTLAEQEAISEFSELARLSAEAWEKRLNALERERETLAFLGHELRTPLQSARTSLVLLSEDRNNTVAWQRLQRAQDRLVRATHAVLWLGAESALTRSTSCIVAPVIDALIAEFMPLATSRGQLIESMIDSKTIWTMPAEVAETVLANLLLNAIQHGGPGNISLVVDENSLKIVNPARAVSQGAGFGLGLELVQRLLERFGWNLERNELSEHVVQVSATRTTEQSE